MAAELSTTQKSILKKSDSYLYNKAIEVEEAIKKSNRISSKHIFCLVSESLNNAYLEAITKEAYMAKKNGEYITTFVTQGIFSVEFLERLSEINKKIKDEDENGLYDFAPAITISPSLFEKYNITKVPSLMYSNRNKGLEAPFEDIQYIIRGTTTIDEFIQLISMKEK